MMRREIPHNLYCHYCGNTNQWHADLRLLHHVTVQNGNIVVQLESVQADKVLNFINGNLEQLVFKSEERKKPLFHCANCSNPDLDTFSNMMDTCWSVGCPGCCHCQNWISEDEMKEACLTCLRDNAGEIDEEQCFNFCPSYDYGLGEVRQHYKVTLDDLIKEAGY